MAKKFIKFVREIYDTNDFIALHTPSFSGNEKKYIMETIESGYVSSVGSFVDKFEKSVSDFTGSSGAVAMVNGTAALHAAVHISGVQREHIVITQALTFVATCNVLFHMGVTPAFVDVSMNGLGLCPDALEKYLHENAEINNDGECIHRATEKIIKAVIPMHTFGHPVDLDRLVSICHNWNLTLIEDSAESLGSLYKKRHTGTFGEFGVFSFNGNKTITSGGGGIVLCKNRKIEKYIKHITTTAKVPHQYEYFHDEAGFNYRMPNLNAALGCAQIENIESILKGKRELAELYKDYFKNSAFKFVCEPEYATSNYWLNAIICPNYETRKELLESTNDAGVMTRSVWTLMHKLPMYKNALKGDLSTSEYLEKVLVNIPSSPLGGVIC